ncbi:MAG: inosine/xanthosine triphosphatase [Chloroflexi bacterium]|nr:inosine/xanthosine triphosphatase [Chloroflexota bacterium]
MLLAIGSPNPVKLAAVRQVVAQVWPTAELVGLDVPSGVSAMPFGADECLAGARNRARAAREVLDGDMGLGLEGGVEESAVGLLLGGWVVVVHRDGRESAANTARIPLPPAIAERVRAGAELGPLMDELVGEQNTKQKGGAVEILTHGLVNRRDVFATAVAFALAPFLE